MTAIIKVGQCVWSEGHLRPNRSHSALMQCCVCCGGGGKAKRRTNITERFSSQQLPELGGISLHLVSPSWPSLCFPCSPIGRDRSLTLSMPWPQGHLLLVWGLQARGRNNPPTPQSSPWGEIQQVRPCHQQKTRKHPPSLLLLSTHRFSSVEPHGAAVSFWQPWALVPQWHCLSLVAKGSAVPSPHMPQPQAAVGQAFTGPSRGKLKESPPPAPPAPLRACTPTLTLLRFQELGSCFISAWRYPRNLRKYIGSCASTDLILICELGFFFLLKLFGGATMPKLGWEGKRDSVFQRSYFLSFWLLISRSEK